MIKTSRREQKLSDEIRWYIHLPDSLKRFIPTVKAYSLEPKQVFLEMEFIGLPALTDLYMDPSLTEEEWGEVIGQIALLIEAFSSYSALIDERHLEAMYVDKTYQRLTSYIDSSSLARSIQRKGYFKLNGVMLLCPLKMLEHHLQDIRKLFVGVKGGVIHGDLCFSNMFYDRFSKELKIIDPRGSFGEEGIYGDLRYDLAKFRHSLSGYEHMIQDRYKVRYDSSEITLEMDWLPRHKRFQEQWDHELGTAAQQVKLIEALLFLSMIPLHSEAPDRQLAMYCNGARLFYDVLSNDL
jgi:hypothetical protein